jgi:hypothetical protein
LSAFGAVSDKYPSVSFKNLGDSVAGRIVELADYQQKDFSSGELKFWPKSGDPMMGTRVTLETVPGDESSRVTLWGEGQRLMAAIARAFRAAGASDVTVGDDLAVTFTGMDGRAKAYQAAYSRAEGAQAA